MLPAYIDIHIHTSRNPEHLNPNYDFKSLEEGVRAIAGENPFLLSLTDHNTINKKAYLNMPEVFQNRVILGCELHVLNRTTGKIYHCHIIFNASIDETTIDNLNAILDKHYPSKYLQVITKDNAPDLAEIIDAFIEYDYLLLPHGGQSHGLFLDTIPEGEPGAGIDRAFETELYHNHFDGFTGRNENSVLDTKAWFKKLGVESFTNLITCTDNYQPSEYPMPSVGEQAQEFMPTWMASEPTFSGLRLALSEATRLYYQHAAPTLETEHISNITLSNDLIDIDVVLTPGLNVVIGGSSSGKTLFVNSLAKRIRNEAGDGVYSAFGVSELSVRNPSRRNPHYISQNFISSVINDDECSLESIDIVKEAFPLDSTIKAVIDRGVSDLTLKVSNMLTNVKELKRTEDDLSRINVFTRLISNSQIANVFDQLVPSANQSSLYEYSQNDWQKHALILDEIEFILRRNPLIPDSKEEIDTLRDRLFQARAVDEFEKSVRNVIINARTKRSELLSDRFGDENVRLEDKRRLFNLIPEYVANQNAFRRALESIIGMRTTEVSIPNEIKGYSLTIQNEFCIDEAVVLEAFNEFLVHDNRISSFEDLAPQMLFLEKFDSRRIKSVEQLSDKITSYLRGKNKTTYRIVASDGKDFYAMSPGWRSATLLDIILGNNIDFAPVIIDQPEDNLAVSYINSEFVNELKRTKKLKQVILVTHNATIPMLGDAQTVVLCRVEEESGKLIIRSAPLEGDIDGIPVLDYIADITDGGKAAIRKRVKKYNIKSLRSQHEIGI